MSTLKVPHIGTAGNCALDCIIRGNMDLFRRLLPAGLPIQFLKYCSVGVLNTLVDFTSYFLLTRVLWIFAESITVPKALSYLIATACSFLVNRFWTFEKTDKVHWSEVVRFYGTVGLGIFINVGIHYIVVTGLGVHDLLAVLVAAGGTAVWGFSFARFYVFKR